MTKKEKGEHIPHGPGLEVARVLAAAVVNPSFCYLLLAHPKTAIEEGYKGEKFLLTEEEKTLILSIHADTLPDFAKAILVSSRHAAH